MKYNVIVATHHKTGTVWMDGVFKAIARDLDVECIDFDAQPERLAQTREQGRPFILLSTSSRFGTHADLLDRPDVRILHVIRDPRDVIISAMHYHKKSGESWLHEPIPGYDNAITYQRRLRTLPTRYHQYVFEMDHSSSGTVHDMQGWRYDRPNCFEARYEALRQDGDLAYWTRISTFLGFEEKELLVCRQRFWDNSLFGGLSRLGNKHVRNGDTHQWKREFNVGLAYAFLARFPRALQELRYEPDHRWILGLSRAEPSELASSLARIANFGLQPVFALSRSLSLF
ncbi:MAG: sulfotransferase domain-containing protein [Proteobacteria bacterium]|nr:sulfotransferase domain-containing protein [Pseudomonadota bacterium]